VKTDHITSPTTSATYTTTTGTLSLSGSASDTGSGLSGISWASDKGGGGNAAGSTSWSVSGISLYNGSNVITVTASDNAANSSTDTLTVTYTISDTTKPIGSTTINNNAFSTDSVNVTLSLSATDNIGLTGYYVSESSTTPTATQSGWVSITSAVSYSANPSFPLSSGDGTKSVYVWYKDAAGNVSTTYSDSVALARNDGWKNLYAITWDDTTTSTVSNTVRYAK